MGDGKGKEWPKTQIMFVFVSRLCLDNRMPCQEAESFPKIVSKTFKMEHQDHISETLIVVTASPHALSTLG